jgi:PhoPQ-activated pathogenicity-related protein
MKKYTILFCISLIIFGIYDLSHSSDLIGPSRFFDMNEIRNETTLDTKIVKDLEIDSKARKGKKVRLIELTFTSQNWHDSVWKHPARIYIPENYQREGNVGIIGTYRGFFQEGAERSTIPGTQLDTEAEYAEGTALDLGVPIMVFAVPAEDYFGLHESDLMGYSMRKLFQTRDLTWFGYYPIIKSYLRAITLLHAIPDIRAEKAVLLGCSKRGYSVCVATGVDPERVAGIVSTCYFGGNNLYWIAMKFAQFGPYLSGPAEKRMGPGYQPAAALLDMFNNPLGLQLLLHFDPYMWRNRIKSAYMVAIGTNDEFYALGTPNSMMGKFKGDKAFLAIDNTPHTWVSKKHLAAWRMWLAHTFCGREIPKVDVKANATDAKLIVTANVGSESGLRGIRLFYAYNKTTDWRFAKFYAMTMRKTTGGYTATVDRKKGEKLAYYVEVEDYGKGGRGYVSSLVEIIED